MDREIRALYKALGDHAPSADDALVATRKVVRKHASRALVQFMDYHQDLVEIAARADFELAVSRWADYPPKAMCGHLCAVYYRAFNLLLQKFRAP